jgi:hypothetical protein
MLKGLPEEVAEALRRMVARLREELGPCEVYLYGSYAKGTWLKTSDVDLIVVSDRFCEIPYLKRLDWMNRLSWELGDRPHIEAIPLTPKELKDRLKHSALLRDAVRYWIKLK